MILGSSNVFNHRAKFIRELEYNNQRMVTKCTSLLNFEREITNLDKIYNWLTISGLDLVLSELRGGVQPPTDAGRLKVLEDTLRQGLVLLCDLLQIKANEGVKISVAPLVHWDEFDQKFRKMSQDLMGELSKKYPGLYFIPKLANLNMTEDGVHLEDSSAARYIEHIEKKTRDHWDGVEELDVDMDQPEEVVEVDDESATPIKDKKGKRLPLSTFKKSGKPAYARERDLDEVRKKVDAIQADLEERQLTDVMFIAKHEEALDELRNEKILNRVIFTGVWIQNLNGNIMEKDRKSLRR